MTSCCRPDVKEALQLARYVIRKRSAALPRSAERSEAMRPHSDVVALWIWKYTAFADGRLLPGPERLECLRFQIHNLWSRSEQYPSIPCILGILGILGILAVLLYVGWYCM